MKTGILYFTTCFQGFGILRHVDPFVKMLHIYYTIYFIMIIMNFILEATKVRTRIFQDYKIYIRFASKPSLHVAYM